MKPVVTWAITRERYFENELAKVSRQEGLMLGGHIKRFNSNLNRKYIKVYSQDSGGFQLAVKEKLAKEKFFVDEKKWMDKRLMLYDFNKVDFGVILDHPLVGEGAEPFSKALRATIRNTKYMEEHRSGKYRLHHVLKGLELYLRYKSNIKLKEWKKSLVDEVGLADGYCVSYPILAKDKFKASPTLLLDLVVDLYDAISDLDKKPLHIFAATGRFDFVALSILGKKWKNTLTTDSSSVFRLASNSHWIIKKSENIYTIEDWKGEHFSCPIFKLNEKLYGWNLVFDKVKHRFMVTVAVQRYLAYHNIRLYQEMFHKIWKATLNEDWEVIGEIVRRKPSYVEAKVVPVLDKIDKM